MDNNVDLKEAEKAIKVEVFDILAKQEFHKMQYEQLEKMKRERVKALQDVQKAIMESVKPEVKP